MLTIGLTGGIGSGKSTVSRMLVERGAHLIDADILSRKVVEPIRPAWKDIVDCFGKEILNPDQTINRQKLGEIIFNDSKKRDQLNRITHPRVWEEERKELKKIEEIDPDGIVVLDIPLLIEKGNLNAMDFLVVVYVPRDIQIHRLMKRDNISVNTAKKRIDSQLSLEEKAKIADYVIDNGGSPADTEKAVENIFKAIRNRVKRDA